MATKRENNILQTLRKNNCNFSAINVRYRGILSKINPTVLKDLIALNKNYPNLEIPTIILKTEYNKEHFETIIKILDTWPESFNYKKPNFYTTIFNLLGTANISPEFRKEILETMKFYSEKNFLYRDRLTIINKMLENSKSGDNTLSLPIPVSVEDTRTECFLSNIKENISNEKPNLNLNSDLIMIEAMEAKLKNIPFKHFVENLGGFSNLRTNPDFGTLLSDLKKIFI